MLKEKSIVDLCLVGLRTECERMLKCNYLEIVTDVRTFDDLQKPIIINAINMYDDVGIYQTYQCLLKEAEMKNCCVSVNLTKLDIKLH